MKVAYSVFSSSIRSVSSTINLKSVFVEVDEDTQQGSTYKNSDPPKRCPVCTCEYTSANQVYEWENGYECTDCIMKRYVNHRTREIAPQFAYRLTYDFDPASNSKLSKGSTISPVETYAEISYYKKNEGKFVLENTFFIDNTVFLDKQKDIEFFRQAGKIDAATHTRLKEGLVTKEVFFRSE